MLVYDGTEWVNTPRPTHLYPLAGNFRLVGGQTNAMGEFGWGDANHTRNVGAAGAFGAPVAQATISQYLAGGYIAHRRMQLKSWRITYRQNNVDQTEYGFLMFKQTVTDGLNDATGTALWDDVENSINRARPIANRQYVANMDTGFPAVVVEPGEEISFATRVTTGGGTNRVMNLMSGYMEFDYV